ncbi:MAG: DNA polymerase III subunit alpha [Acholeplasmataceae bacterium]|nr:DNA polymerase III subunit alpha [Acholeplasmataceae bacterium]
MRGVFGFLSEYNLLNSVYKLNDLLADANNANYPFVALNDTNNLYGSYKLFKTAKIPYIIGMKLAIIHLGSECSILCYALNNEGYENLIILSSMVQLSETKRIDFEDLIVYQEGLYFISASHTSDVDKAILDNQLSEAKTRLQNYKAQLKHFSIGLGLQNLTQEIRVAPILKEFSQELDILLLPVNYMAYRKEDTYAYDAIIQVQNPNRTRIDEMDLSFLTLTQLEKRYSEYQEVFTNLSKVFPLFRFKYQKPQFKLPKLPEVKDSQQYLKQQCYRGLNNFLNQNKTKNKANYFKRLDDELAVINKLGYNDYFLIVWDFVKYAKTEKILVGPGRGSAAGSLTSFTLGITEVDPLEHGLLFERFLNVERQTMPDIDLDFPDDRREQVIEYIKNKYGSNRVLSISTFSRFSAKSAIRDICRIKNYSVARTNEIVKQLTGTSVVMTKELAEIDRLAKKIDGLPRQTSTHAAGIILAAEDLRYLLPLQQGPKIYQSQYEHEDLVEMGLLKIDLLGIRNLSIITRVLEIINEVHNKTLDLKKIPYTDQKTYQLLARGDTLGIFQLESVGMRNVLRKLKPREFKDLVALLALYRPGPMENIDLFIKRRNREPFSYVDDSLKSILSETYGIIVYQEQIMMIAQQFAGYTLNEADTLRIGISKKDHQILNEERKKFINRSESLNKSSALAAQIYDYIVRFADYGFNKSHSVAYSIVAYQMAYLKANYYNIFMAVLLSKMGSDSNIYRLISEIREKGIQVLPPDINVSTGEFVVTKKGLVFPFTAIRNIGFVTAEQIINERQNNGKFKNYSDLKTRLEAILNERILNGLIFSGALDSFGQTRKKLDEQKSESIGIYQSIVFDLKEEQDVEYELAYLAEKEKEVLGFNLTISPLIDLTEYQEKHNLIPLKDLNFNFKEAKIVGQLQYLNIIQTKKGETMAFIVLTDFLSRIEITVFPALYAKYSSLLKEGAKLVLKIRSQDYGGGSWVLEQLKTVE